MLKRVSRKPVWLNTAGGGVAWLHVRLDDRPKYYGYQNYKSSSLLCDRAEKKQLQTSLSFKLQDRKGITSVTNMPVIEIAFDLRQTTAVDIVPGRTKMKNLILLAVVVLTVGCESSETNQLSLESNVRFETESIESAISVSPAPSQESSAASQESSVATPEFSQIPLPSDGEPTVSEYQPSIDELLLFFPTKYPSGNWNPDSLDFEDVWITSDDGTRIHGWYCPCKNPRAYVLYAHGNAGNLSDRSALMTRLQNELRVAVLIFDYRGYGRSDGMATTSGVIADTRAAAKFLASRAGVDNSKLVLMGRSLGGAVVIQVATEIQPRGLIVESSFSSLKQVAVHHYPKLAWLVPRKKLDSRAAIASFVGPLFLSHGTHDRTIPYQSGTDLFAAANEPKSFFTIQNADHNDQMPAEYYSALSKFIDELPD